MASPPQPVPRWRPPGAASLLDSYTSQGSGPTKGSPFTRSFMAPSSGVLLPGGGGGYPADWYSPLDTRWMVLDQTNIPGGYYSMVSRRSMGASASAPALLKGRRGLGQLPSIAGSRLQTPQTADSRPLRPGARPKLMGASPLQKGKELASRERFGMKSTMLLAEAHRTFTIADSDTSGYLDLNEIAGVQRLIAGMDPMLLKYPLTPEFAKVVRMDAMDKDGNGLCDREEWIEFVALQAKTYGERPIKELMKAIAHRVGDDWKTSQGGASAPRLKLQPSPSDLKKV